LTLQPSFQVLFDFIFAEDRGRYLSVSVYGFSRRYRFNSLVDRNQILQVIADQTIWTLFPDQLLLVSEISAFVVTRCCGVPGPNRASASQRSVIPGLAVTAVIIFSDKAVITSPVEISVGMPAGAV
jgi:hypothetical protein